RGEPCAGASASARPCRRRRGARARRRALAVRRWAFRRRARAARRRAGDGRAAARRLVPAPPRSRGGGAAHARAARRRALARRRRGGGRRAGRAPRVEARRRGRRQLAGVDAATLWDDVAVARLARGELAPAERAAAHAVLLLRGGTDGGGTAGPQLRRALRRLVEVRLRRGRVIGVAEA